MILIDKTYFVVDCFIAQLSQITVQEKLTVYINRYEPRFFSQLLGTGFYNDFIAGLQAVSPQQRWFDLKNGKTYQDSNGNTFVWEGLANNTDKVSAAANYVYYWYTRSNATFTTGSGEIAPKVENGTRPDMAAKQATAWNELVRLNYSLIHFLQCNRDAYPEWKGVGWADQDYEYFIGWWPVYYTAIPYRCWWPEGCDRPDIFSPLNDFGI